MEKPRLRKALSTTTIRHTQSSTRNTIAIVQLRIVGRRLNDTAASAQAGISQCLFWFLMLRDVARERSQRVKRAHRHIATYTST